MPREANYVCQPSPSYQSARLRRADDTQLAAHATAIHVECERPRCTTCTEVDGPIISDTTWTLANSPYIVVANVEVWQGVTLTIQPGVVVKFNKDKLLQVNGTLIRGVLPQVRSPSLPTRPVHKREIGRTSSSLIAV